MLCLFLFVLFIFNDSYSQSFIGTGADGAVTSAGGTFTDATHKGAYSTITANIAVGATTINVTSSGSFSLCDAVILMDMNTGSWERVAVKTKPTGSTFTIPTATVNAYPAATSQAIRAPQYTTFNLTGGTLTTTAWNGSTGGVIWFYATGAVTITGTINCNGLGYTGGIGGGAGAGGAIGVNFTGALGGGGGGGGGAGATAGNVGNAGSIPGIAGTAGGAGSMGNGPNGGAAGVLGGNATDVGDLIPLLMGSGGGGANGGSGGGGGGTGGTGGTGGNVPAMGGGVDLGDPGMAGTTGTVGMGGSVGGIGGTGGGIIYVQALSVAGAGSATANGTAGGNGGNGGAGGEGGAGGDGGDGAGMGMDKGGGGGGGGGGHSGNGGAAGVGAGGGGSGAVVIFPAFAGSTAVGGAGGANGTPGAGGVNAGGGMGMMGGGMGMMGGGVGNDGGSGGMGSGMGGDGDPGTDGNDGAAGSAAAAGGTGTSLGGLALNSAEPVDAKNRYSITNGNWSSCTTWSYTSAGGPCLCIPKATDNAVIEGADVVQLDVASNALSLTVGTAAGAGAGAGELEWPSGQNLTIHGNTGVVVAANGTLDRNTNTTGGIIFDHNVNGVTFAFSNAGVVDIPTLSVTETGGNSTSLTLSGANTIAVNRDFTTNVTTSSVINTGTITVGGNLLINGNTTAISNNVAAVFAVTGDVDITANNMTLTNNGTFSLANFDVTASTNDNNLVNNLSTLNFVNVQAANADFFMTNTGTINQTGTFLNPEIVPASSFTNGLNGRWNYGGTGHDLDTRLFCTAASNVFNYNRNGSNQQMIRPQTDDYWHLEITNTNTKAPLTAYIIDIEGNLTISGSSEFDVLNPLNDITIAGNWINTSSVGFNEGVQSVTFDGVGAQSITCSNIGTETYYNLFINKYASGIVTMNNHVSVDNILDFNGTDGFIALNSKNLTINSWDNGDITGYTPNEFVIVDQTGFIKYTGVDAGEVLNIPMGLAVGTANYALADLTMTDPGAGTLDANLCFDIYKTGETCFGATAETDSVVDYTWNFISTSNDAGIKVYWAASKELPVFDRNLCSVVHFDGTTWKNLTAFGAATAEGGPYYSRTGPTTAFSPFGVQMGGSPLPIELLSFNTSCNEDVTSFIWVTASELNNKHFILQGKTVNGVYQDITAVQGIGNSASLSKYEYTCSECKEKNYQYYRLVQVDFDGQSSISKQVAVNCEDDKNDKKISLHPTITSDNTKIVLSGYDLNEGPISYQLIDHLGKKLGEEKMTTYIKEIDVSHLANAMYYVVILQNSTVVSSKFIKY